MAGEHVSLPLSIALTEFHVVVAYADRVKAVNILDERPVFSQSVGTGPRGGAAAVAVVVGSLCRDASTGHLWLQGNRGLLQVVMEHEDARVSQIYMEKAEFDLARKHAKVSYL